MNPRDELKNTEGAGFFSWEILKTPILQMRLIEKERERKKEKESVHVEDIRGN